MNNITQIASKFNQEHGRAIIWKEAMNLTFDGNIMTDIDDWFMRAAELYAESVKQFTIQTYEINQKLMADGHLKLIEEAKQFERAKVIEDIEHLMDGQDQQAAEIVNLLNRIKELEEIIEKALRVLRKS